MSAFPDPVPSRVARRHRYRHGISNRFEPKDCWHCQRELARCVSKVTYTDRDEADQVALDINCRDGLADPVVRYVCDFGSREDHHWHIGHAKNTTERKRARRAWRLHIAALDRRAEEAL